MLKVANLSKRFGDLSIFKDFDLMLPQNGFTVLIGPSGCGKSTLFNVLTGVVARDSGEISWCGEKFSHLRNTSAYMQQKDLLLPWFSLMDNALLPAKIAGEDMAISGPKALSLFKRLGLEGFETYLPGAISGGMKQRCALVRTLMFERALVLLDEPLSALDAITRSSLQSLLLMLQYEFEKSILMITHDIDEALRLADEVLVLSGLPMRVLDQFSLKGTKPRRLNDPELIKIKDHVLNVLQKRITHHNKIMIRSSMYSLLIAIALLAGWELACREFNVPDFILPTPSRIMTVAVFQASILLPHAGITALEVLIGIMLSLMVAVPLSIVMFAHPSVENALAPFLVASQAVPVFAVAPLLVVWLGYGIASKVLMAAIIIFFPITVNLLEGFKSCDQEYRKLFQLMGAGFWKTLRWLYWPWALPHFFAGLKVGVSVATIGAVIGEWVGAQQGLGYLMIQANARLNVDMVFAAILWLSVMGLSLWVFVGYLERKVISWR